MYRILMNTAEETNIRLKSEPAIVVITRINCYALSKVNGYQLLG